MKKLLKRSQTNYWLGGVCGGLAEYFGMDSSMWRLIFLLGALFSVVVPFTLIYIIMWIIIPEE